MNELLNEVVNWFRFGLEVGVPYDELQIIREDYFGVKQCLIRMLIHWTEIERPTWTKVVRALENIENLQLAWKIKEKYGMCIDVLKML